MAPTKPNLTRPLALAVLLAAFAVAAPPPAVLASGSIGGGGGVSQFGQMYKQGKVAFFQKLACQGCPIQRSQVDKDLAKSLVESIKTRDALKAEPLAHDETISLLCPGANAKGCAAGVDEQEMVQHYLSRRFGVR